VRFEYTDHAEEKILERKLDRKTIERTLIAPDRVMPATFDRKIAQRKMGNKLLRVVYEEKIVTAYYTKQERYG
jgi:hypothetical protein